MRQGFLYAVLISMIYILSACDVNDQHSNTEKVASADKNQSTDTRNPSANDAADPAATESGQADKLVIAFGDSLYAGYRLAPGDGFVPDLQTALRDAGLSVRVHNAGVSGDTTAAGLRRLTFVLDSLDRKPDLMVLGLGGNDMLRGIKPDQTRANLDAMLTELKQREIPAVLTGMLAAPNLGQEYGDAFNQAFPALALKYETALDPFFMAGVVGNKSLMLGDGIHPNAAGIDVIVKRVAPIVQKALE